jgi:hypothetical protein
MIKRIFSFYFEDGKYDATLLEDTMKKALGLSPIFDSVDGRPSGMRFAVTATTISDATLCLISNYNGEGQRDKELSAPKQARVAAKLMAGQGTNISGPRGRARRYCSGRRE